MLRGGMPSPRSSGDPPGARWFISAPVGADLRPLIASLRRRGAQPYVLSDVAPLGANLLHSVHAAITAADRVLVVLGIEASMNSVFEAGVAVGLGKPLIVLADPRIPVPPDLAALLTIRARLDELDAIDFTLDQLERAGERSPVRTRSALPTGRPLGGYAEELLDQLADVSSLSEAEALGVLTQALEMSGAVPAQNPAALGIDLGVWSDDLDAIGANPLLIEVKRSLDRRSVQQVMGHLAKSPHSGLALIIHLDPAVSGVDALRKVPLPVLAISLQELLGRMRGSSFAEVVRQLRNASVHPRPGL